MLSRRSFTMFAMASLCALAVASGPSLSSGTRHVGKAYGTWELPLGAQNGYVDGYFYEITPATTSNPMPVYHFTGSLVASPVACPACIAGTIHGVLDDGIASTPNLSVVGTYSGMLSNGSGSFTAQIYRPTTAAPIGQVSGTFSDPSVLPVLGHFNGKWLIHN